MAKNQAVNILIIGGGVIGASIAFHLAEAGAEDVLLLDKGPIASGTTPNAAGQTSHLTSHKSAFPFSLYCSEFFDTFADQTGYPIELKRSGSLRIAMTEQYTHRLQGYVDAAESIGDERVRFIDQQEAEALVPLLTFPEAPAALIYNGGDGYIEEPQTVALAYAAAARDRGVTIQTNVCVTELLIEGDRIRGVQTTNGPIEANHVIVAAGAWTRQLGQRSQVDVASVPIRHQAYVTVPSDKVPADWPITRVIDPQLYVRSHKGGMLVGGYGYRPLSFDMDEFPADFEISSLEADAIYFNRLQEAAVRYFPILNEFAIAQERRGLPTVTPDAGMMVSAVDEVEGLIVATGCQVAGVAYSPGIGRVAADLVLGQESALTAGDEFAADRFGDLYASDARLRDHCETTYGTMYWGR